MTENLIKSKYDISPETVYKKGPYMHSVVNNFIGNNYDLHTNEVKQHINRLKDHLSIALTREQEFYDLVGVVDADDFSNTYLYSLDKNAIDQDTINRDTKIIQKILISISSTIALKANKKSEKFLPTLHEAAVKIIRDNEIPWIEEAKGQTAFNAIRTFLEELKKQNKGGTISLKNSKGKKIKIALPKGTLRSDIGSTVKEVIYKLNPDIKKEFTTTPKEKIANYKQYFIREAEKEGLTQELILPYWERILVLLTSLEKTEDSTGNIAAFTNFLGAEGALGEIAISITLEDVFQSKASVEVLANDTVESVQKQFSAMEGKTVVKKTKDGSDAKFTYKSPTDILITIGDKIYPIQVKTSYTELSPNKALKLQGNIELQSLLGNMVSQGYLSNDMAQLLIYTMVNLSTPEMREAEGSSNKMDLALRILQGCLEYFAESYYAREISEDMEMEVTNNNMGNMFFIYSGRLIPMSSFIKAAIAALEGGEDVFSKSYLDMVTYKEFYPIEEIKKHNYLGRFELGSNVYEQTKIGQLSFIIAKMDENIKMHLK